MYNRSIIFITTCLMICFLGAGSVLAQGLVQINGMAETALSAQFDELTALDLTSPLQRIKPPSPTLP
jgi:hypothetical protein